MRKIVVRIGGGLGNQMFQCAYGRFLADVTNGRLLIDKSPLLQDFLYCLIHCNFKYLRRYGLGAFSGPAKEKTLSPFSQCFYLLLWFLIRLTKPIIWRNVLKIANISWTNILGGLPSQTCIPKFGNKRTRASTIFCSGVPLDTPLLPNRQNLRRYFSFPPMASPDHQSLSKEVGDGAHWCSIHIRRSDYLTFGGELDTSYYEAAIGYIKDRVKIDHWLFFSDDINWCRENFADMSGAQFFEGDYKNPLADMHFMTLCSNHIIANSTFSWWGAYLGQDDGVTVYPASWYKPEDVAMRFPKSWKGL